MTSKNNHAVEVADIDARFANLHVDDNLALGVETKFGLINVNAAAASLGLPAPRDVDDLLQNRRGSDVLAVLNGIRPMGAYRSRRRMSVRTAGYTSGENHLRWFQLS